MPATCVRPESERGLCRSAFSYAVMACSRSPICSATRPGRRLLAAHLGHGGRTYEEPGLLVGQGELVDGAGGGVVGVGGGDELGGGGAGVVGGGGVHGGVAVEMGRGSVGGVGDEGMGVWVVHAHVPVWLAGDVTVGHGWGDVSPVRGGGGESRQQFEAGDIYTRRLRKGKSGTLMGVCVFSPRSQIRRCVAEPYLGTITADHRSRRR